MSFRSTQRSSINHAGQRHSEQFELHFTNWTPKLRRLLAVSTLVLGCAAIPSDALAEVTVFGHSMNGTSTFYQYSGSTNTWSAVGSLSANYRRSQFASDIMGNVFAYNDSSRRVERYLGGTMWESVATPSLGRVNSSGYNLEVTNNGRFLYTENGSNVGFAADSSNPSAGWQSFSIGANANLTGDYDPLSNRYVVGLNGAKQFREIDPDTLALGTLSSSSSFGGGNQRMGSIVDGFLVENTSNQGIRRWDMDNLTGPIVTLNQVGGDGLASGVDRNSQTLYTYDFNGGQFGTLDVNTGNFSGLASGSNLGLSSIVVINSDVDLNGITTQSRYDRTIDSLTVGGSLGSGHLDIISSSSLIANEAVNVNAGSSLGISDGSSLSVNTSGISGSGTLTVAGTVGGGDASVTVGMNSTLNVSDSIQIGDGSLMISDGGTVTTASAFVGGSASGPGTISVANGGGLTISDTLNIHAGSSVTVDSSSSLVAKNIIANGDLNWSGGQLGIGMGQTFSGSGDFSGIGEVTIRNGGTIAPGNSTGLLVGGDLTWGSGGIFEFEINDFAGTAGSSTSGWDLLNANSIELTATASDTFLINLVSLDAGQTAGLSDNFDDLTDYQLMFASTTGGITGFSSDLFSINTSGFQNPASGVWGVSQIGNNLFLNYTATAIPEPSTFAFLIVGGMGLAISRRRRSSK